MIRNWFLIRKIVHTLRNTGLEEVEALQSGGESWALAACMKEMLFRKRRSALEASSLELIGHSCLCKSVTNFS